MTLNEISLEKKFESATNSQDSIQSLSLWILHHKSHHKRIVQIWMKCFEKAKASHRLTLFYLANDVIQHAKRKSVVHYVDDYSEVLKDAIILIKGDKISGSVDRVLNIWLERNIYSEEFISELKGLLSGTNVRAAATSKIVAEFKLSELIDKIKRMRKIEQISRSKLESLSNCKVDATSSEVLNKLKDKTHGEQFSKDFDEATKCLETVITSLDKEVLTRTELVEHLERSEIFYETQKDEARIVVNAYKNFSLRVKNVSKKLNESKQSLPSPLPSPPRDAPSPTNSDDGPNLPSNDLIPPEVNAFLNVISGDESKGGSSLDQRLSSLIHSIPHVNDQQNSTSNRYPSEANHLAQSQLSINNINNNYPKDNALVNSNNNNNSRWNSSDFPISVNSHIDSNMTANYTNDLMFAPQTSTTSNDSYMYDYNYSHQIGDVNRQMNADIRPIQALISAREESQKSSQISNIPSMLPIVDFHDFNSLQQPLENFEPADMDLGNSDEEDNSIRLQTHRNIKVIDTRRNSNEIQANELKLNNGANEERSYNSRVPPFMSHSYPLASQMKSVARMPMRTPVNNCQQYGHQPMPAPHPPNQSHPAHHQQQWRPHSPMMLMNAPHPHNRNNWRLPNANANNRNSPRKGFRRY